MSMEHARTDGIYTETSRARAKTTSDTILLHTNHQQRIDFAESVCVRLCVCMYICNLTYNNYMVVIVPKFRYKLQCD